MHCGARVLPSTDLYTARSCAPAGICCVFERDLKERNPDARELTYDVRELHRFIDDMADISALVCAPAPASHSRPPGGSVSARCSAC